MLPLTGLGLSALLVLASWLIWRWLRARASRAGRPPARLTAYLLNAAIALPAITLWLGWLLARNAPLSPLDRWLVAFALAWIVTPFAALAVNRLGEALSLRWHRPPPGRWS